jgi:hypothetical protein
VPVAAAFEAEVLAGDPDPLEVLRGSDHLLDQVTVLRLDPGSLGEAHSRLADPFGQAIANRLQLAEIEHPGRPDRRFDVMRHLGAAESLAEEAGQLRLEATDLAAQLEPSLALVDPDPEPGEILSQQSGHPEEL